MSTASLMTRLPVVRVMVPLTLLAKVIVSAPGFALACAIASRRLPVPLSLRLPTV
jgi:hypothetical protein